jgi:hypothetical protein
VHELIADHAQRLSKANLLGLFSGVEAIDYLYQSMKGIA